MIIERALSIDPYLRTSERTDVRIGDGHERVDGAGLIVAPGFIDLHAHLREPGGEDSETVATGARAALRGGFTTVCAMPNTEPPIDTPSAVAELVARGAAAGGARVLPIAAITRGRRGRELADLVELAAAGAVMFSDDGAPVDDARLMRSALEYAAATGRPVSDHAQDAALAGRGVMHEGTVSAQLGLSGIPAAAEEVAVARDLALARMTGARLHIAHVSTASAVALVRAAKHDGVRVTCEVTPHHLAMTDEFVAGSRRLAWQRDDGASSRATPYDASTKVNPPLRPLADVHALWEGLRDGTIDAIATDHAPHASVLKDVELDAAAFGISGLETALPLLLGGVAAGWCELETVIAAFTVGPARVLGRELPDGDVVVIDTAREWTVEANALVSKGKNTPLLGATLTGRVVAAAVGGEIRFSELAASARASVGAQAVPAR